MVKLSNVKIIDLEATLNLDSEVEMKLLKEANMRTSFKVCRLVLKRMEKIEILWDEIGYKLIVMIRIAIERIDINNDIKEAFVLAYILKRDILTYDKEDQVSNCYMRIQQIICDDDCINVDDMDSY